ncbi:MAG: hypothetical protein CL735_04590 [Chloroflexi bacterium]|nr:hypothetical protein [Chloroflexota bacterium]|tara:strand:- start:5177 stop:5905 length:729 start_codon:yes stop_codon:yes gene_type:complete
MSEIRNVEQILPAVRSLIAKELINNHNVSKADVSKILGISPAAVTQYTKNKRGSYADKLEKNKEVRPIIASLAEHFSNKKKKEGEMRRNMTIIETSENIISIINNQGIVDEEKKADPKTKILQERVEAELREARTSLNMANKIEDGFGKLLFKGIASDSIRHAEIVSQVIRDQETVSSFKLDRQLKKYLKQMIEEEENASEQSMTKLVKTSHPAVRALLQSVDQDEMKHKRMLKSLSRYLDA